MTDWVRVRDARTGHHITITAALAASDTKRYRVLKSPAVNANGMPLPPKFKADLSPAESDDDTPATPEADAKGKATKATTDSPKEA